MNVIDVSQSIMNALSTVDGLAVTNDPGTALLSFPAAVVSVPNVDWVGAPYGQLDPTNATFLVFLVVDRDSAGYSLPKLMAALNPAVEALWTVDNLVVTQALTGVFPQGTIELPCYIVTAEVAL